MSHEQEWKIVEHMLLGDFLYTKDYNENHDPDNGQFTSGSGGSGSSGEESKSESQKRPPAKKLKQFEVPELKEKYASAGDCIVEAEHAIRNNDWEIAVISAADGRVLLNKTEGKTDSVTFTPLGDFNPYWNSYITHNHPAGTPFSPNDVIAAVKVGAREMRACHKNGAYVLTRKYDIGERVPEKYELFGKHFGNYFNELLSIARLDMQIFEMQNKDKDKQNKYADKLVSKAYEDMREWFRNNSKSYGWEYREEKL